MRRNSPHNKLSVEEVFPHGKYGDKSVMWKERCGEKSDLSQFILFSRKICFVAIYAVFSRNLFDRDLLAFAWRKFEPKILSVEKKGQI